MAVTNGEETEDGINGPWGFVDCYGNTIIEFKYDAAKGFSDGLAPVRRESKWGYINQSGEIIIKQQFNDANKFSEGLAAVKMGYGKWGYINKTGKLVIPGHFDKAYPFRNGLACVMQNSKYGFINKTGEFIIELEYGKVEKTYFDDDGILFIQKDQRWVLLNIEGKQLSSIKLEEFMQFFDHDWTPVKFNNKWGHIDKNGNIRIANKFDDASWFYEGVAPVRKGDKFGYINELGEFVIKPQFAFAYGFSNGIAAVSIDCSRVVGHTKIVEWNWGYIRFNR